MSHQSPGQRIVIVLPMYDDWAALDILLGELDRAIRAMPFSVHVLVIDDGSSQPADNHFLKDRPCAFGAVSVLRLRANLGHQRAIAVGLAYIAANLRCRAVVVMDSDGEDRPSDVPILINACELQAWNSIVFASRAKRLEGITFRSCYRIYRYLHRLLTGTPVRVGNFSIVPFQYLNHLTALSDLWNHYAAAVFRSKLPHTAIPLDRGARLAGRSKMNFIALLVHGLSALSVHADLIAARVLVFTITLLLAVTLSAVALFTTRPAKLWLYSLVMLLGILLQAAIAASVASIIVLASRNRLTFLPYRDCPLFIECITELSFHGNLLIQRK